jgi:hypothetical protein
VLQACHSVVPNVRPVHILVRVEPYSKWEDCHRNVAKKISIDGGSAQCGWIIWEIPDWEVQIEFHSVWRSFEGNLVDITPPMHKGDVVLFLSDSKLVYEGRNIPTIHYPYRDTPFCKEYVEIADAINRLLFPPGQIPSLIYEPPKEELDKLNTQRRRMFLQAQLAAEPAIESQKTSIAYPFKPK